jgi:hypothetical protein
MSIVKNTPHILKHSGLSFTTLLNKTLESIKDPATLGIYVYLASKPSDWDISETNLQNRFCKGRDFIRARLAELKLIGLLKSVAIKDKKGRIVRWETILFSEVQVTENPSSGDDVQITENPPSGSARHLVDPPTTNKRSKQIKDLNKPPISPKGESNRFDEFWDMYPVKTAKKACIEKWKRRNLDSMADVILDKLYQQVSYDDSWLRGFAPNPLTYINQDRWDDEIKKAKAPTALANYQQPYDDTDTSWIDEVKL